MTELFQGIKPCSSCIHHKSKGYKGACTNKSKQIGVTCHEDNKKGVKK